MKRPLSNSVVPALCCALVMVASAAGAQTPSPSHAPRPAVAVDVSALTDSAAKRVDALALETRVTPWGEPIALFKLRMDRANWRSAAPIAA